MKLYFASLLFHKMISKFLVYISYGIELLERDDSEFESSWTQILFFATILK